MIAPIFIFENVILKTDTDLVAITEKFGQFTWLIWIVIPLCGLALFYLLFQMAIKARLTSRG
jgi:uncharacterized membrane protein YuzA (DUF378 family)